MTHVLSFKPALISKGLRPLAMPRVPILLRFKPALISKGLRLPVGKRNLCDPGFKPALISKGLRHRENFAFALANKFQTSPDFKGIKTVGADLCVCPGADFKIPPPTVCGSKAINE